MTTAYRIRDWRTHFEVSQSLRIVGPLSWVGIPTKHDGKSFRRLIRQTNGPAHFGCWCLIVQIAAKCPIRGVLADADGPLTADDLGDKTGCPAILFEETLQLLSSKHIGWIEEVDLATLSEHDPPLSESAPSTGPDQPDRTGPNQQRTGAGLGAGDFENHKNGTTDIPDLRPIDAIMRVHLPRNEAMAALQMALNKSAPGFIQPGSAGLLLILGAAERAIEHGTKPAALFSSIVKHRRWGLISDEQKKKAEQRLNLYQKNQSKNSDAKGALP